MWKIERSSFARKLVNAATVEDWRRLFGARIVLVSIKTYLVLAIYIHFAAGQTRRIADSGRIANLLFRDDVIHRRGLVFQSYIHALLRGSMVERAARQVRGEENLSEHSANHQLGLIALKDGRQSIAQHYLHRAIQARPASYLEHRLLGRSLAVEGRYEEAAVEFQASVKLAPNTIMAHQNYAGRYDVANYQPKSWELQRAGELLIYDNLGQHAEDLYLRGRFDQSLQTYAAMLDYQEKIAIGQTLPAELQARIALEARGFRLDLPVRILPYEWVTQFGHIGLIEAHLKRVALGHFAPANHILLAPAHKVANHSLLNYFDDKLCVIRSAALVDEIFPYQRYFGEGFIVTRSRPGGPAEPFSRAAARANVEWSAENRPPIISLSEVDRACGCAILAKLGVPEGAWYVGLHVREGGYYDETPDDTSGHRNARIEDYFGAIEEITSHGGWVVRLGDRSMTPLPRMERVIDYAHSPVKSEQMDLFLLATSHFVIGTTSGLTTAAQVFGTQMLLVNCVSADWQAWGDGVDFVLRRVWSRAEQRYLSIGETYRQPLQGMLINNLLLDRLGLEVQSNSSEEIRSATRYKLEVLSGGRQQTRLDDPLLQRYRREIAHDPYLFGAGRPALPYIEVENRTDRLGSPRATAAAAKPHLTVIGPGADATSAA